MSLRLAEPQRSLSAYLATKHFLRPIVGFLVLLAIGMSTHAGLIGGLGRGNSVGGVAINAAGVVRNATVEEQTELANQLRETMNGISGDLAIATHQRTISLKGILAAVDSTKAAGDSITAELEFLAGLTQVDSVAIDEANADILISGPAEPWEVNQSGFVVGSNTGRATLRLADLLVALRHVEQGAREGISCSIEPTAEGRRRLQMVLKNVKLRPGQDPSYLEPAMKEAFGPQMIRLSGVANDSRFARTMVAADFEMKRIAMGLAPSQVDKLPSYLDVSRNASQSASQNPRWWMTTNFEPLRHNTDKTIWAIAGDRIETRTEQDVVARDGSTKSGGKDALAQKWADLMNQQLTELMQAKPVFGELRNVIDLTVVATLIYQENLESRSGLSLEPLRDSNAVDVTSFPTPHTIDPQCSFVRGRKGWTVTASGGVDINAVAVVDSQIEDAELSNSLNMIVANRSKRWFWDGVAAK